MSHLPSSCSPQPPPRLVVSLIQPPEGMPLSGGAWPSHPVWPLEVPTTPPDNVYPLPSPTSTGVSNSEEEADQEREEGTLGQGQFKRTRPVRGKRSGTSHRTRERSNSDTMLPHSGSDSTLQKDGSSRCSTPDSSESDDAKTEDTATTMTLLAQGDRGESHPVEILSVLTLDHGLTQRQLQLHGNAKKKDRSGPARHLSGESSAARSAVRRPRREDTGDKESPGPGGWQQGWTDCILFIISTENFLPLRSCSRLHSLPHPIDITTTVIACQLQASGLDNQPKECCTCCRNPVLHTCRDNHKVDPCRAVEHSKQQINLNWTFQPRTCSTVEERLQIDLLSVTFNCSMKPILWSALYMSVS